MDDFGSHAPTRFEFLHDAREIAARVVPLDLLDLCAARIRTVMGRPLETDDLKLASVAEYSSLPIYSERERLALEFTEQYVIDVAGMQDSLVDRLQRELGPQGLYGFVLALYVIDQSERLALTSRIYELSGGDR